MSKFRNFWKWFGQSLKDSSWFSAYVQLLFLAVTIYALFLTNITENIVTSLGEEAKTLKQEVKKINLDIENLSLSKDKIIKDKITIEEELRDLKELKSEYVSNISEVVINNIILELEKKYKNSHILNEKLATMQDFQNWLTKWGKEENHEINPNLTDLEKTKRFQQLVIQKTEEEPKSFSHELREVSINWLKRNRCTDCNENEPVLTETDVFNQQKEFLQKKSSEYGYEVINSVSITLLPTSDKTKLEHFLNNYSKKAIYQKPIYLRLTKWDYKYLKNNSIVLQKNISDLESDLPNLKNELKNFFNKL
ncbi:MAG: hypothetical protein A2887_06915 [Alphaproteobacteria bacterium RIFCSPLOWO2_01_FULL_40_26]|nr:MAG: hypothetical protein A3D15_02785 [Alphaproteobacteria bacterium RIFCSPHIGHO2_02_FULL_40_34]OFW87570.1 MAG: hypothetical protein A2794_00615 [Alphaproteobacteria bacterium RIFCSPHIGHO2_01_FULL_40_8]OFW95565.1 MAG: hypothetical protein A2887_06915 [Alphaproteobacteria bacterium RIFCSPLOWO2_01_FULL_40_26]OFX09617.1 MAG: hypothetical protein A3H30_01430 [Alphaproteobacteria bacterium RIFCSPLOWO2_02_FULL_40_19]OFX12301.1 MAG: hypothetical protein A3G22_06380 [Alphaproteobacteria bacterium RI